MKKKNKKLLIGLSVITLLIVLFVGTLYYITSTVNNYSYTEKKWINDNTDTSFDIYVEKSLPIFSNDGKGVYYDYLTDLKTDTGLSLNIVTTDTSEFKLSNKNTLDKNDIVIYKDHFVVIGEKNSIDKLTDLSYNTIGVLNTDKDVVSYYLTEYKNITIKNYSDADSLEKAYTDEKINFMIIPMYKYMENIIRDNYEIAFHLDGLYSYYCISLDEKNENLSSIMTKFYYRWEEKASKKINEYFLDIYYDAKNYREMDKESITNDDFIVGYIENLPYEGLIHKNFTGLTNTYLEKFADMTGVTYKYVEYETSKDLNKALKDKKIDLALNYYSLSSDNYTNSRTLGTTDYVVLAHVDNNLVVNSLYSLAKMNVEMLANMNLKYNMSSKNLFEIKDYANVKTLIKNNYHKLKQKKEKISINILQTKYIKN